MMLVQVQVIVWSLAAATFFVSIEGFTPFHRQQQVSFARGSTTFQFRYVSSSSSLWGSMEDLAREWASRNSEEGGTGRGTMLTEARDPSMPPGGQSFGTMAKPDDKVKDWVMGDDDSEVGSTMPTAANGAPPGDGVMMGDLAQQWTSLNEDQDAGAAAVAADGGASAEPESARAEPAAVNVGKPPAAAAPPPTNGMDELAKQWASVNADHDSASTMPPVSAFVPPPPPPPPPPRDGDTAKSDTAAKPAAPSVNMEDLARQWASVNADHDEDTTTTSAPKEPSAPMAPPVGYLSPEPRTVKEAEPVVAEEEPEPVEEPEPEPEPAKKSPPEPEPIVAVGQDVPTREFDGAPLQLAFWFLASCLALLPLGMGDLDPTKWTSIPGPALRPEVLERREQEARLGTTTPPTSEASPPTRSISGFFGLKPLEKKQPVGKIPSAFFAPKQEPAKTETKEEEAPASKFSEPVSPTKEEAAAAAVAAEQETAKKFSEPVSQTKEDADAAAAAAQKLEQDLAAKKFTEPTSALKPLPDAMKEERESPAEAKEETKTEEAKLESLTSKLFAPIKEKADETKTEAAAPEAEAAPAPEAKVEEPKVTSPVKEEAPAAPPKTEESTLESLAAKLFAPAKEKEEDTKTDAAAPETEAAPVAKEEDKSKPVEEKALEPVKAADVTPKEEPKPEPPKEEAKPEPAKAEAAKLDIKKEKAKKADVTPEPAKASKPEPVKAAEETKKIVAETPKMKAEPGKVVETKKDEKAPAPVFETFEDVMGQLKK